MWEMTNLNTVYTTLKRYVRQGLLFRIYKGFYALKPLDELDPYALGLKAMHGYAYISTETILQTEGIIQQVVPSITIAGRASKRFTIGSWEYYCRKLSDQYLYNDAGIREVSGYKQATIERAVADMLYFNPRVYFDNTKAINWERVRELQKTIGYPPTASRYPKK